MPPGISVLIPAHNEERTLDATLEAIISQDHPEFEVIVIDDCSTDRTAEIARSHDDVRLVQNEENRGLSSSLDHGLEEAEHDIICSLHADCEPVDQGWMNDMLSCLKKDVGIVTCPNIIREERFKELNVYQKQLGLGKRENEAEIPDGCRPAHGFDGKGDMLRREALEDVGGFSSGEFFRAGEDGDLQIRLTTADWEFRQAPTAIYHNHGSNQEDFRDFIRKKLEYAEAKGANRRKHGRKKQIGLWNEATKSALYAALAVPYINLLAAALILLKIGYQANDMRGQDIGAAIAMVPFLVLIADIASSVGFWKGYVTGQQTL